MTAWGRDNPWRQGCVLPGEAVEKIGLSAPISEPAIFVVVSHDCDLAQLMDAEPVIEVVCGHLIESPDGNCTYAKNPRRLHLPFSNSGRQLWFEILATEKFRIPKDSLSSLKPDPAFGLPWEQLTILQRWLAVRYRRAAFPDTFEKRLQSTGIKDRLTKILAPLGDHIHAVFFDVDGGEEVGRVDPDDTYTLGIYLLVNTGVDPQVAEAEVAKASGKIVKAFQDKCLVDGEWTMIELVFCEVISDEALTYRQSTLMKKWNLDHYSLRDQTQPEPVE